MQQADEILLVIYHETFAYLQDVYNNHMPSVQETIFIIKITFTKTNYAKK